ncbi:hypothetical protein [Falsirhodobacter algicola]|uniref:Uncharacterized protein n=1 Tax=Falsirhodobacter algicola TaxID=2692330 RepID=A0A8J8MTJ8_9RHOB|nr:hypothetical protein [Falsirhodobacter algicola]QUS35988.1 hypothetical protein GR316_06750 [Falsirhodobacter algicola]
MAELIREGFSRGIWTGIITGLGEDTVEVVLNGAPVPDVDVAPVSANRHKITVPIRAEVIEDGVQSFVIQLRDGSTLGHFTLAAGSALDDDMRAEIDLLRAELDLLKRAFRRHCAETSA